MLRSRKLFSIIFLGFILSGFLALGARSVLADALSASGGANNSGYTGTTDNTNTGFPGTTDNTGTFSGLLENPLKADSFTKLISQIADFLLTLAIPLAFFMMILAGFRFVLAQGNEEKLTTAKRNLLYTIIGVAVIFASKILVTYIKDLLEGGNQGPLKTFINRVQTTLNLVIGLLFTLVTVYFIWGIVQYVSSGGDEEKLNIGKRHMIWGIIGMAIMAAAWPIVSLIVNYIGG